MILYHRNKVACVPSIAMHLTGELPQDFIFFAEEWLVDTAQVLAQGGSNSCKHPPSLPK